MQNVSTVPSRYSAPAPMVSAKQLGWSMAPQFEASNVNDMMHHFDMAGRTSELGLSRPFAFEGYRESLIRLNQITLTLTTIGAPEGYEIGMRPHDEFCLNVPLRGEGWIEAGSQILQIKPQHAIFLAPSCPVRKHWSGPSEVLTVHIPNTLMVEHQGLMLNARIAALAVLDFAQMTSFFDLVRVICTSSMDEHSMMLHPLVACHLEKALLAMLARMLPSDDTAALSLVDSPAIPFYVRRAEQFMRANLSAGLALTDLANIAGVSPRTLQYGFKEYRHTTPMLRFKAIRLACARSEILKSATRRPLSEIARAVGYTNASHFSSDYRAIYGETPSQTSVGATSLN